MPWVGEGESVTWIKAIFIIVGFCIYSFPRVLDEATLLQRLPKAIGNLCNIEELSVFLHPLCFLHPQISQPQFLPLHHKAPANQFRSPIDLAISFYSWFQGGFWVRFSHHHHHLGGWDIPTDLVLLPTLEASVQITTCHHHPVLFLPASMEGLGPPGSIYRSVSLQATIWLKKV